MNQKDCFYCKQKIDLDKDKYVLLGTYNNTGKKKTNEDYFHFQCFTDWFTNKVTERISIAQEQAMGVLSSAMKNLKLKIKNV